MRRLVTAALLLGLGPLAARAQAPDEEWSALPVTAPTGLTAPPPPPTAPLPALPMAPPPQVRREPRTPEAPNSVSMLGARPLGRGRRGELAELGFPLSTVRLLVGVSDRVDLGLAVDTFFFLMNEPRLVARVGLVQGELFSLAASLEGGYAFFVTRAAREVRGARWTTGRRNVNVSPALTVSLQPDSPRAARVFLEARYTLSLDTEPFAADPLSGVPASVVAGHNGALRGGAELPLGPTTSVSFCLGLEVHGRPTDARVMPSLSVGLVTSL